MKADEIDKIIAEAVNESKRQSRWHRPTEGRTRNIDKARRWLNTLFMIGFVVTIIVYFVFPEQKMLFFGIGFGSILLKLIEFYLRFMF